MERKLAKIRELQEEQKLRKTEIKSLKKQIPYFIIGFILLRYKDCKTVSQTPPKSPNFTQ